VLVGIGFLILLNNFGWLHLAAIQRFWPLLLIVAGAALLRGALQRKGSGDGSAL
jgi:hypothetical protein